MNTFVSQAKLMILLFRVLHQTGVGESKMHEVIRLLVKAT